MTSGERSTKVIIADTQALTSAGLHKLLSALDHFQTIDVTRTADELSEVIAGQPHFVFIDYLLFPDFSLEYLIRENSRSKFIALTSDDDHDSILNVIDTGIHGFLTKDCSKEEIYNAIHSVEKGERFFCQKVLEVVINSRKVNHIKPSLLSDREREVIKLIAQGNSTTQIASLLTLSHHTINSHRKNIIRKLNIKSPTEFVVHAIDLGLIKV
jgi:DNA-binding NarL/FixJ family response regulator